MIRYLTIIVISGFLFGNSHHSVAQDNIFMFNGTVQTCDGSFQDDSGGTGAEGAPYSDADYTFTICPDNPGDVISVEFLAFALQTSPNYQNSDFLTIFDGDNTGEASLGSYTGSDLQGLAVTGTINNTSGCLTFLFNVQTGNTENMPGWEGLISCTTPCDSPTSMSAITDPIPANDTIQSVGVCIGELVTFSDIGSTAGDGFSIETWHWDFGDGTIDSLSGTEVSHFFSEPGEYLVNLSVEDDNGCFSLNLEPLQVLVSTVPVFNSEFNSEVCLGGQGSASGVPLENVTWTALPPQVVAGETYLADGAGFSYSSGLTFDFFESGAVLENCEDLQSVFVNMEHSYLGDLLIQLECPDGTTVTLLDWANDGGWTFLGEAVDDGSTEPGTGYDYGWAPGQTNGNIDDQNNWSDVSYTDNAGNAVNNPVVDPGLYESDEDLCNLVGCPLNGTWTFTVVDNLAIDNGYIFEWGLDFNPYLYPDVTTFTPIFGTGSDSSWWEGPYITWVSDDGNEIEFDIPEVGTFEYTYVAINNFGCTLDTTITVEIVDGPVVDAGVSYLDCADLQLDATIISNDFTPPPCTFIIEMFNDEVPWGWDGATIDVLADGNLIGNFTTFGTTSQPIEISSGQTLTINFFASMWGTTGQEFNIYDDDGNLIYESGPDPGEGEVFSQEILCVGEGQIQYEWTPTTGLDDPFSPNPAIEELLGETEFTVTAWPAGFPGCASTDMILVEDQDPPDPGEDNFWEFCPTDGEQDLFDLLGGDPDQGGVWMDDNGNEIFDTVFDPSEDPDGQFTYSFDGCDDGAVLDLSVNILNLEASQDTTICIGGTAMVSVELDADPAGQETIEWNGGLYTGQQIQIASNNADVLEVVAFYGDGCVTEPDYVEVSVYDPLSLSAPVDETICQGEDITLAPVNVQGGLEPYSFQWNDSAGGTYNDSSITINPLIPSELCVTITDACESPSSTDCVVISLEEIISADFEADTLNGCFPIAVNFIGLAENTDAISTVEWDFGDDFTANTMGQASHVYSSPGLYDVSYTIFTDAGCIYSDTVQEMIYAYPFPLASFTASPEEVVLPWTTFDFINLSTGYTSTLWEFGGLGVSTEDEPSFEFPADLPGSYPVTLLVANQWGCLDSITRNVEVLPDFEIYAPNTFTPDDDGINEVWDIEHIDVDPSRFSMTIFNRWGDVVFLTNNPDDVWDGSHQEGDYYVPDGVYVFHILAYSLSEGIQREIFGHINLIR